MPISPASSFDARRAPAPPVPRLLPVLLALLAATGCGKKGPPLPPTPRGPLPPASVQARQLGERVEVRFDVPAVRGPRPSQEAIRAELIRVTYPGGSQPPADPDAFRRRGVAVDVLDELLVKGKRILLTDGTLVDLPGGAPGRVARYAIRLRDRRTRPSALVVAPDIALIEPGAPPTGLRAEPTADGIRLTWEDPEDTEGVRFNLYRNDARQPPAESPVHPQPLEVSGFLDTGVETGRTYRYTVRRSLAPGMPFRESASSEAVIVLAADRFAPPALDGLVAVPEGDTVRLFWNPSSARDLGGYRIYRSIAGGGWERIGDDSVERATFIDRDVQPGQELAYRVTAIDRVVPPNESEPSEAFRLQLPGAPR